MLLVATLQGNEVRREIGNLTCMLMDLPDESELKSILADHQQQLMQHAEESYT